MPVSTRAARAADADRIAELTTQLGYELSTAAAAHRLAGILSEPTHAFWVAELDGQVVGFLHAMVAHYIDADPFVMIGGLVVDDARRGQGIGHLLMAEAEAWAATQGCALVRVWSSDKRAAAHRFYEKLGYTMVKTQHAFAKSLAADQEDALQALVPRVKE
jgi:GNAT superfamily N-acetyltransferase